MSQTITAEAETVSEEPVPANSRKREFVATAAATTVTVVLGLVATGIIERVGKTVKNRIAPQPEKKEDE
jgi:hypothetical protein